MNATSVRKIAAVCIVGLLLCPALASAQAGPAFYVNFNVPGSYGTVPTAINNLSSVTGYFTNKTSIAHGFVRDVSGKITTFDPYHSFYTYPFAINDAGAIIGFYEIGSESRAFLRNPDGTFANLEAPGVTAVYPFAINALGVITGGAATPNGFMCFVRSPQGKYTLYGPRCGASSINLSGEVVGSVDNPPADRSFLSSGVVRSPAGAIRYFQVPGASFAGTYADHVDAFGDIEGSFTNDQGGPLHYLESPKGRFTTIAPEGADPTRTTVTGLSDLGELTGYYTYDDSCPCDPKPYCTCYQNFVRDLQGKITKFDFPVPPGEDPGLFPVGGGVAVGINMWGVILGSGGPLGGILRVPY